MRSQVGVFIDAGYLVASAATRVTGSSLRRGVEADYAGIIGDLIDVVAQDTAMPLLRVYWYDAARNGIADYSQKQIAALPRVKVRLGHTALDGTQKGVDLRIGLDMVSHSWERSLNSIYLVSGDSDLAEAVEDAQAKGVRVIVVAVPTSTGEPHGVSHLLREAADDVLVLSGEIIDRRVRPAMVRALPTLASRPTASNGRVPSPADVAAKMHPVPAGRGPEVAYSSGGVAPAYIAPEYDVDQEERGRQISNVVSRTLDSWCESATAEEERDLLNGYPSVPYDLDRAMLVDLADSLGNYDLEAEVRSLLRRKFWELAKEE